MALDPYLFVKRHEDVDRFLSVTPLDVGLDEPHLTGWMTFVDDKTET